MKKLLALGLVVISLTSCHMEPDKYSDQEILYGETLITTNPTKENDQRNNSFIYDPERSDCFDCPLEEEEFDPYY